MQTELPTAEYEYQARYDYVNCHHPAEKRSLMVALLKVNMEHTKLIHQWMNQPHVARYWQQAWPIDRIQHYLEQQIASYHEVFLLVVNDKPVAYTELYPVSEDRLAQYCTHHPNDWGWHMLIGPPDFIGCGLSPALGQTILRYLFEQKHAPQVFCEPDSRNLRMINFVSRLQHKSQGLVQLGNKLARIMMCEQGDFMSFAPPSLSYKTTTGVLA